MTPAIPLRFQGKFGLVNLRGELIAPFKYDWIGMGFENRFRFIKDGRTGFLDSDGNVAVRAEFDASPFHAHCFSDGMVAMRKGERFGYIDQDGAWRIQPKWDMAFDFFGEFAITESSDGYFVVDREGDVVSQLNAYDIKSQPSQRN